MIRLFFSPVVYHPAPDSTSSVLTESAPQPSSLLSNAPPSTKAVLPATADACEPKEKGKAKKSPLRGGKKADDESNNSAKKSNNPKLSTATTTANSNKVEIVEIRTIFPDFFKTYFNAT